MGQLRAMGDHCFLLALDRSMGHRFLSIAAYHIKSKNVYNTLVKKKTQGPRMVKWVRSSGCWTS